VHGFSMERRARRSTTRSPGRDMLLDIDVQALDR
jgi:hypothetical protein